MSHLFARRTNLVDPRFLAYALLSNYEAAQFILSEYGGDEAGIGAGQTQERHGSRALPRGAANDS